MFDLVTSIKELNLSVATINSEIAAITTTLATIPGGNATTPSFTGLVNFAAVSGPSGFSFDIGNGNGASYSTYNSKITLPTGIGLFGANNSIKGYIDGNFGFIDMKGGFRVNGVNVLTANDFHAADYAALSGATFTGGISAPTLNIAGAIQAGASTFSSLTTPGGLAAASASISGAVAATSLTLSQNIQAAGATLSGALSVTGATTLGNTTITDLRVGTSGAGGLHLVTGDATFTGYVEFTKPGGVARTGYIGYANTAGVMTLAAEINGGYFNFVTTNGAVDPKVNGNTIWHSGNFTPSTSDLSAYLLKSSAVLTGAFDAGGFPIANAGLFATVNGTGRATISTTANTNNLVIQTGPSSGLFSTVFGADGSLGVPGALSVASGGATISGTTNITGATNITGNTTVAGDITTHRNSSAGAIFLGNTGSYYLYFDGSNYQMPAADLYVNGSKIYTTANFDYSVFLVKGGTYHFTDTNTPVLQVVASSQPLAAAASQGSGAFLIVSADDTTTSAYISFLNSTRYAINFGLDTSGNLAVGGWSMGNTSYPIYHGGNFPGVMAIRLLLAGNGDNSNDTMNEKYPGAVVTGQEAFNLNGTNQLITNLYYRYLQVKHIDGNWYTVDTTDTP
jgi:hypothetical protein